MTRARGLTGALLTTLLLAGIASAQRGDPPIRLRDGDPAWYKGRYSAYVSPWGAAAEKARIGIDYADAITIRPRTFPDGTVIETLWPTRALTRAGVWGYMALSYGNYDGGAPPVAVVPRRVRDIRILAQSFAYRYAGSDRFNLLTEFYLTSRAGDSAAKVVEIGFLLHTSPSSRGFVAGGRSLGSYVDADGRRWLMTRNGNFVTIAPSGFVDVRQGRIDMRAALAALVRNGTITGAEWFNGVGFGTEPTVGAGRTRIDVARWRVDYR